MSPVRMLRRNIGLVLAGPPGLLDAKGSGVLRSKRRALFRRALDRAAREAIWRPRCGTAPFEGLQRFGPDHARSRRACLGAARSGRLPAVDSAVLVLDG